MLFDVRGVKGQILFRQRARLHDFNAISRCEYKGKCWLLVRTMQLKLEGGNQKINVTSQEKSQLMTSHKIFVHIKSPGILTGEMKRGFPFYKKCLSGNL